MGAKGHRSAIALGPLAVREPVVELLRRRFDSVVLVADWGDGHEHLVATEYDFALVDVDDEKLGYYFGLAATRKAALTFAVHTHKIAPADALRLGRFGVARILHADVVHARLHAEMDEARCELVHEPEQLADAFLGKVELPAIQRSLRDAMMRKALRETEGNQLRAAQLLGVQRMALYRHTTTRTKNEHARDKRKRG